MKDEFLFKVSNAHTPACGQPPSIDGDTPDVYYGYFANVFGEQIIYMYDRNTDEATVRLGDAGWDNVYRVVNGRAVNLILPV